MKRYYRCPDQECLEVGSVAEIYTDFRNRIGFEGRARILEELDARTPEPQRVYIRAEIGSPKKQAPHTIIWTWKRFRVEFIDGPNKGFITARKIAYFLDINSYYESGTV